MRGRQQDREEQNDPGQTGDFEDRGHDRFGQPFMSGPWERGIMGRKDIVSGNLPALKDHFAGSNVIAGVSIGEQAVPAAEYENHEKRHKNHVADRRQQGRRNARHPD